MKKKYEFSVRMQQRHLRAIFAGGSASAALGARDRQRKRCLQDTDAALGGKRSQKDTGFRANWR